MVFSVTSRLPGDHQVILVQGSMIVAWNAFIEDANGRLGKSKMTPKTVRWNMGSFEKNSLNSTDVDRPLHENSPLSVIRSLLHAFEVRKLRTDYTERSSRYETCITQSNSRKPRLLQLRYTLSAPIENSSRWLPPCGNNCLPVPLNHTIGILLVQVFNYSLVNYR